MKKRGFDGRMRSDLKGEFFVQQADQLNESRGETLDRLEQARAVNRAAFAELIQNDLGLLRWYPRWIAVDAGELARVGSGPWKCRGRQHRRASEGAHFHAGAAHVGRILRIPAGELFADSRSRGDVV